MGRGCNMQDRDEKYHIAFWCESQKGRDHLDDLGVDGRIY